MLGCAPALDWPGCVPTLDCPGCMLPGVVDRAPVLDCDVGGAPMPDEELDVEDSDGCVDCELWLCEPWLKAPLLEERLGVCALPDCPEVLYLLWSCAGCCAELLDPIDELPVAGWFFFRSSAVCPWANAGAANVRSVITIQIFFIPLTLERNVSASTPEVKHAQGARSY